MGHPKYQTIGPVEENQTAPPKEEVEEAEDLEAVAAYDAEMQRLKEEGHFTC